MAVTLLDINQFCMIKIRKAIKHNSKQNFSKSGSKIFFINKVISLLFPLEFFKFLDNFLSKTATFVNIVVFLSRNVKNVQVVITNKIKLLISKCLTPKLEWL